MPSYMNGHHQRQETGRVVDHEMANPEMEAWTDCVVRKLVHAPGGLQI